MTPRATPAVMKAVSPRRVPLATVSFDGVPLYSLPLGAANLFRPFVKLDTLLAWQPERPHAILKF